MKILHKINFTGVILMNKFFLFLCLIVLLFFNSTAHAFNAKQLVGKWRLVEIARDVSGQPCPFVSDQIEFTADGRMLTVGIPVVFRYLANPDKTESKNVLKQNPELKDMELMLIMEASQFDWSKAPIAYGVKLSKDELVLKLSGYTPARYRKET